MLFRSEQYVQSVNRFPMLSAEREQALARRYRDHEDLDAARELVLSHLRVVVAIARNYLGYGLPHADLIQEGNIGLMKAVKRFDPDRGVRLVSFAIHWIKAEIHEFVLRNWRLVRIATTKAQRKLFFNLRSAKKRLGWLSAEETEAVASDLGVSAREVTEMEQRLSGHDVSFDPAPAEDEPSVEVGAPEAVRHLTRAEQTVDWVIVDSPPVGMLSDGHVLSRLADAVVLVIRASHTPHADIQRTALATANVAGALPGRGRRFIGTRLNWVLAPPVMKSTSCSPVLPIRDRSCSIA